MNITALVHTFNEERNIKACLQTLKWADEIVVIDMNSDDKTVEICEDYTENIYSFNRVGFVEPARKYGIEKCNGEWILIVDADERIPLSLSNTLRKIVEEDKYDVIEIPNKNHIFGKWIKHTGWYPDYHPRFFKKGFVTPSDKVHGNFKTKGRKYYLKGLQNSMYHFGYTGSKDFIDKLNRYTDFEVEKMIKKDKKFTIPKMMKSGFYEFRRRYFKYKGYKDGIYGLLISLMRGFYHFLIYVKYWEYLNTREADYEDKYIEIENKIIKEYSKNEFMKR